MYARSFGCFKPVYNTSNRHDKSLISQLLTKSLWFLSVNFPIARNILHRNVLPHDCTVAAQLNFPARDWSCSLERRFFFSTESSMSSKHISSLVLSGSEKTCCVWYHNNMTVNHDSQHGARELPTLTQAQEVWIPYPRTEIWDLRTMTSQFSNRSYIVNTPSYRIIQKEPCTAQQYAARDAGHSSRHTASEWAALTGSTRPPSPT